MTHISPVHNPDPMLGLIYLVLILSGISIVSVFLSYIINGFIQYFCVKPFRKLRRIYNDKKFNIKVAPVVEITTAKTTDLAITGYAREIIIDEGCEV